MEKLYRACEKCASGGVCQPCRGSGRTGYFLTLPGKDATPCRWCKGSALCDLCSGTCSAVRFEPHICVEHSLSMPGIIGGARGRPFGSATTSRRPRLH